MQAYSVSDWDDHDTGELGLADHSGSSWSSTDLGRTPSST